MAKHKIHVFGNEDQAIAALQEWKEQGYDLNSLSVVSREPEKLKNKAEEIQPDSGDNVVAGAAAGGALGLAGMMVGMSAIAIPGIGPILAAGPIIATLGGAAAGAATNAGGLTGALKEAGLSAEEANEYESAVKDGKILVIEQHTV